MADEERTREREREVMVAGDLTCSQENIFPTSDQVQALLLSGRDQCTRKGPMHTGLPCHGGLAASHTTLGCHWWPPSILSTPQCSRGEKFGDGQTRNACVRMAFRTGPVPATSAHSRRRFPFGCRLAPVWVLSGWSKLNPGHCQTSDWMEPEHRRHVSQISKSAGLDEIDFCARMSTSTSRTPLGHSDDYSTSTMQVQQRYEVRVGLGHKAQVRYQDEVQVRNRCKAHVQFQ